MRATVNGDSHGVGRALQEAPPSWVTERKDA
jgi:hypothetical protein